MIRPTDTPATPGLGLKWPQSWKMLVATCGSNIGAARFVGIHPGTAREYSNGTSKPRSGKHRRRFEVALGWRVGCELPDTRKPKVLVAAARKIADRPLTVADKARGRLCRMIWRRNPHMHWADRFVYAITESAKAKVINSEALKLWARSKR